MKWLKTLGVWEDRHTGIKREREWGGGWVGVSVKAGPRMSHQRHWGGLTAMPRRVVPPVAIQISCKLGRGRAHIHKRGQQEGPVRTPQSTLEHNTRKIRTEQTPRHSVSHTRAQHTRDRNLWMNAGYHQLWRIKINWYQHSKCNVSLSNNNLQLNFKCFWL